MERFFEKFIDFLPNICAAIAIYVAGLFIIKLILKIMSKGLNSRHIDVTIHKFITSIVHVVLTIIVIVMALSALKVPMASIVTTIGAAGLAIGLALQDSLSNVAGGFIILFSQPFKCGDYIKIDNSEGNVDSISILYTRLLTIDNKAICIPNGSVAKSTIINLTAEKYRHLELKFSISYSDDYHKAISLIRDILENDEMVLNSPEEPLVVMCEHSSSAIIILMRAWVPTENYWEVRFRLLEKVKDAFDSNGISIPFDQLDVHIKND